ncbi:hypothetical protein B0H12DRAFT_1031479, partial [Mycena haematopus]
MTPELSSSNPLAEELTSLRALVDRFQTEAHSSAIKLQRHALSTSADSARVADLEAENRLLTTELAVLRANPENTYNEKDTVAELTLSLRRLNAKLSLTETALAEHTRALAESTARAAQQRHAADEAYALAARLRGREEEGRQREAAMQRALVQAREETRLTDGVVREYAALVRNLDDRARRRGSDVELAIDGGSTPTLVAVDPDPESHLEDGKTQLAALVQTFGHENDALAARVETLEAEREVAQAQLAAANTLIAELGDELARAKFEREQARVDDRSAAGMVERYMRFTQQTTTALHASLKALRARHAATLETLHATVARLTEKLGVAERETSTLRTALDAAALDVLRESVARRREVALRVRMVGREERVRRALGAAVRRHHRDERHGGAVGEGGEDSRLREDVRGVLRMLDADISSSSSVLSEDHNDEGKDEGKDDHGSQARISVLEGAVQELVRELEGEVGRRVADADSTPRPPPAPAPAVTAQPASGSDADSAQSTLAPALTNGRTTAPAPTKGTPGTAPAPAPTTAPAPTNARAHPLLADLAAASTRYAALQAAFRECHLALQDLRAELESGRPPPTHTLTPTPHTPPHTSPTHTTPPRDVLRLAVERLYDWTEDARVELEIRVADGRVLVRGWEAIGALELASGGGQLEGEPEEGGGGVEDVRRHLARDAEAQAGFRSKLDDVEHDIAVLKR